MHCLATIKKMNEQASSPASKPIHLNKINKNDPDSTLNLLENFVSQLKSEGMSSFSAMEHEGRIFILNTGLSFEAIVRIILEIAARHEDEFMTALGVLQDREDALKNATL